MSNSRFELEEFLFEKADRQMLPIRGIFELSPVCNLDCKMCYVRMSEKEARLNGGLKTADEWLEMARKMKEAGTLFLLLTGGEVFLYKDFKYLYTELTKMGFVISINTNGTLINEEILEWLAKIPPRYVSVTLYGSSDETYKRLCNDSKGYSKVTKAIDMMLEKNITVKVTATITPYNKDDIYGIHQFTKNRDLRCDFVTYTFPPTRKCNQVKYDERLSPKEAAKEFIKIGGEPRSIPARSGRFLCGWAVCGLAYQRTPFTLQRTLFKSKRRYRNERFSKNMRPCFCESGSALYLRT